MEAKQRRVLGRDRPPVVVATPGRLWELVSRTLRGGVGGSGRWGVGGGGGGVDRNDDDIRVEMPTSAKVGEESLMKSANTFARQSEMHSPP